MYTDADGEESLISALEEGDFEIALQLLPTIGTIGQRVGPDQLTPLHYACQHGRLDIIEILVQDYFCNLNSLNQVIPNPLQIAAASGHLSIVEYLLTNTANLDLKPGRVNAFHLAADNGHVDIMKHLLAFNPLLLSMVDHDGNTPLHHACVHGHLHVVTFLCNEAKHSVVVRNKRGEIPLHLATKNCHIDVVKFLIDEKCCDPSIQDTAIGCTPLHLAAKSGCLDIIQYLANEKICDFECKTSPKKKGKFKHIVSGRTPLHYASFGGHCDTVAYLIEEKLCNPSCVDDLGFTPLHLACQEGHSEVVRFLLTLKEVDPNEVVTNDGFTLVHAASLSGNLEIIKLLIDQHDGDASIIDSEGRTALHYSCRNGHTDIAKYLVQERKSNCNCVDQSHMTPLHLASQYGHLDTVKYLVTDAKVNSSVTEDNGYTALHLASNKGHLSVVEFLVSEKHINCMVRDKVGRTPLHHSCESGHTDVVQYLTNQPDCDCTCQEKSLKASPLHLAASFGYLNVVRHLVEEKGCSPTCTDKFNSTPIHRAAASGHSNIMNYFVKEKQCSSLLKNKFGNTPLHSACQKDQVEMVELLLTFSKENMMARNQVGRMPLDLTDNIEILSIFLRNGIDPSKSSITAKFPYLKSWDPLIPTVKIFLLGDLDTGKSTLAKTLQGSGFFQEWVTGRFQRAAHDSGTSGIVPITFDSKYFGRVVMYDFAGHPCYHASHSVIINVATKRSSPIFLITVDLRKSSELIEKSVVYWCDLILSISNDTKFEPHIILIGTHEDELSKDGIRHKPAVLENIVVSGFDSIKFGGWVTVDSRRPNSANIHKLRQIMTQRCDTLRCNAQLDHNDCLLHSFMLHKFQGTIVIEFDELLEYLSHANIPDIKSKESIFQACQSLHSCGYLLFLESRDSIEPSWIIHNQEAILSMVHGFHKLVEIPNPLGLVSISQLQTSLGRMGFNMSLAIKYLLRMEFCIKLANRKILYSISGFEPTRPPEDHFFFPHLIRISAPQDIWESRSSWDGQFGWYMECTEATQSLGPRFFQLLLLRLASHFPFNTNPNFPFGARRSSCVIWRRGLSWTDSRGIEAVVEIQKHKKAVMFLSRFKKSNKLDLDFYHLRSSVIRVIRQVKHEACSHVKVVESIIHPQSLEKNIPLFSINTEPQLVLFRLSQIYSAVLSPDNNTVSSERLLLEDSSVEVMDHVMNIKDLLEFEPCIGMPISVLTKLLFPQNRNETISEDVYDDICETLSEMKWSVKRLMIILRLPISGAGTSNNYSLSVFKAVFGRWVGRNGDGKTYGDLWNLFCQYSIFSEDCVLMS